MNQLPAMLFIPFLALCSCQNEKEESNINRYSAHTFSVAGGLAVITQITDHETDKIYLYELNDKTGLTLKDSVDLTLCGKKIIPFEGKASSPSEENQQ